MFTVQVSGLSGTPQANTGVLYVDHDSNGSFDQYPMSQISTQRLLRRVPRHHVRQQRVL